VDLQPFVLGFVLGFAVAAVIGPISLLGFAGVLGFRTLREE
jgi:hypothetical protein